MGASSAARVRNPPPVTSATPGSDAGKKRIIPRIVFDRMVDAFRKCEDLPDRFMQAARMAGVHRDTAHKAYFHGLGQEWSRSPIKDILANERSQKAAVSTVLIAAKTAGSLSSSMGEQERADITAALGTTEFEKLQSAVRTAVLEEIALVDGTRRVAARVLRAGEKLATLIEARTEALLAKFGPQKDEHGATIPPTVGENLGEEAKSLEALGRTGHRAATLAKLAIEMERLRIGDPDALRRRLDSVNGTELGIGGKTSGADEAPAEGAEETAEQEAASADDVADVDDWIGGTLRVISGGKASPPKKAPAAAAPAVSLDSIAEGDEEPDAQDSGDGPV